MESRKETARSKRLRLALENFTILPIDTAQIIANTSIRTDLLGLLQSGPGVLPAMEKKSDKSSAQRSKDEREDDNIGSMTDQVDVDAHGSADVEMEKDENGEDGEDDEDDGDVEDVEDADEDNNSKDTKNRMESEDVYTGLSKEKMATSEWPKTWTPADIKSTDAVVPTTCPQLEPNIVPKDIQYRAIAAIEHNLNIPLHGILITGPESLGKMLIAQMMVAKSLPTARRYSVVVVPKEKLSQWVDDFAKNFKHGSVDVFVLDDPKTSCFDLCRHDVIIVSYHFVMAQYRKLARFTATMAALHKAKSYTPDDLPKRPNLTLFEEILTDEFQRDNVPPLLILDEPEVLKNSKSYTYQAVHRLRQNALGCVMLSETLPDAEWINSVAFEKLLGRDIPNRDG